MGEVQSIITSCGEYPNVPLMGSKWCINYNPVLAYRRLGYAMDGQPKELEVSESVYFAKGSNPEMLEKVAHAWKGIHKRSKDTLSKKVPIARAPYIEWVKKRSESMLLPFSRTGPLYEQPPIILSDTVPTELYVQSQADNIKLRAKDREIGLELYLKNQEKTELARKLKKIEEGTSESRKVRKRSQGENARSNTSVSLEEHEKVLKDVGEIGRASCRERVYDDV